MQNAREPWKIQHWRYSDWRGESLTVVNAEETDAIAQLFPLYRPDGPHEADAELHRNARLIASAPRLANALEELVGCAGLTSLPGYKNELMAAAIEARAALDELDSREVTSKTAARENGGSRKRRSS